MTVSLDGKVTGEHLMRPGAGASGNIYYEYNRTLNAEGFICGRVTMEGSFTGGWYPDLSDYPAVQKADAPVRTRSGFYAVAFDPHGRLGWISDRIIDPDGDPGYHNAQIIEVLTAQVDPRYLGYLDSIGIPYLFAGETELDVALALYKLKERFGITALLLEGGSILNGAFQRAGVIDELSLVVDPVIGGEGKPLCMDSHVEEYRLTEVKNHDGILWLHYKKNDAR
jgi:riboflavin biosynthesis pyrimidine reductase